MNKITIGDVEILALTDGAGLKLKLDETFPTVRAAAQWEAYYQRYPQVFVDASTCICIMAATWYEPRIVQCWWIQELGRDHIWG